MNVVMLNNELQHEESNKSRGVAAEGATLRLKFRTSALHFRGLQAIAKLMWHVLLSQPNSLTCFFPRMPVHLSGLQS
jgi:hypothetical protein